MGPFGDADLRFAARVHGVPPSVVRAQLREADREGLGFVQLIGIAASIGLQAYQQRQAKKAAKRAEDEARKLEAQERARAIELQRQAAAQQLAAQQRQRALALYQQQRAAAMQAAQLQAQVAAAAPPPPPATGAVATLSQLPKWAPIAAGAAVVAVLGIVILRR